MTRLSNLFSSTWFLLWRQHFSHSSHTTSVAHHTPQLRQGGTWIDNLGILMTLLIRNHRFSRIRLSLESYFLLRFHIKSQFLSSSVKKFCTAEHSPKMAHDQSIHVVRPNHHQADKIYSLLFIIPLVLNHSVSRRWMIWAGWLRKNSYSDGSVPWTLRFTNIQPKYIKGDSTVTQTPLLSQLSGVRDWARLKVWPPTGPQNWARAVCLLNDLKSISYYKQSPLKSGFQERCFVKLVIWNSENLIHIYTRKPTWRENNSCKHLYVTCSE